MDTSLTGLQSQFWFCLCKTWLDGCLLQISLSNKLLRPGINRNSASILWTYVRDRKWVKFSNITIIISLYWKFGGISIKPEQMFYLISLSAHEQHTQHVENLHLVHDLMHYLHGLRQRVSKRTWRKWAFIRWLWKTSGCGEEKELLFKREERVSVTNVSNTLGIISLPTESWFILSECRCAMQRWGLCAHKANIHQIHNTMLIS